ncbi:MAG: bifunctional precorrin-2 dehydrogenase/sirohydrochlorin ferrochelatase [Caldilineaceae bacterium]
MLEQDRAEQPVYPLYLTQLNKVLAIVVGGGAVGERKINGLLAAGAQVRVISPEATAQVQAWAEQEKIEWLARAYQPGDLADAFLAFAATSVRSINTKVAQEAAGLRILCNVADAPNEGNFHVPAVHRQTGLVVAVGSGGQSPKRVKQVRDRLAAWLAQSGL